MSSAFKSIKPIFIPLRHQRTHIKFIQLKNHPLGCIATTVFKYACPESVSLKWIIKKKKKAAAAAASINSKLFQASQLVGERGGRTIVRPIS